eukprot:CAMPEP_0197303028 /NCGR_PEP_ID=MMETSP0890-20130614/51416_1 /TAXON_ID=44058 ORGANISM="Aureoumbra lagunensis, Strain CCMP1510" /NCGR_SAMPLE_ID=MMETSP0890 /ASSEMBLY_ACC=CAM_ASM_000533 /LENGTH=477 /DNA_ID=CAMNT_0042782775 /DNA_START=70 /DNA_END=1500 /DNA_ORIENTATION=-
MVMFNDFLRLVVSLSLSHHVLSKNESTLERGVRDLKALGNSWLPEVPTAAINILEQDDDHFVLARWKTLIDAELQRSVKYFFDQRETYLHEVQENISKEESIMSQLNEIISVKKSLLIIRDGRLYVYKKLWRAGKVKVKKIIKLIADIATKYRLLNVVFLLSTTSAGDSVDSTSNDSSQIPYFVIAKKYGYNQAGILMPNPFFVDEGSLFKKWAQDRFGMRKPQAFWRGVVRWDMDEEHSRRNCENADGLLARLRAISLSIKAPHLWDVKCSKDCVFKFNTSKACTRIHASEFRHKDMRKVFENASLVSEKEHHYEKAEYASWMFNLNLPGSTDGSYSRNLNHLWLTGAVVVQWDWHSVEFYYPALAHGTTHISVNHSNAIATVDIVRRNEALMSHLRHFAGLVGENLLCPRCIAEYIIRALDVYRREMRYDRIFDNDTFFASSVPCENDELYNIYFGNNTQPRAQIEYRTVDCSEW